MNKKELVNVVAEKAELSKKQTGEVVNVVFGEIENALVEGESLSITGFGKFEVRERAARKGRNPSTGEEIFLASTRVPAFKAGRQLKEAIK
jgi:DNA-binding protein HU-beta